MKKILFFAVLFSLFACNQSQTGATTQTERVELEPRKQAKNVILMIGDGMGLTQITAGLYSNNNRLHLERLPYIGLHKPYSSDDLVTDSAAGATAFSAGVKTYNGAIGVDSEQQSVGTILEEAEQVGLATGLIATSTIVHATPASFVAHVPDRNMYEAIAADFLSTDVDLFIGGGVKFFNRREKDERNLFEELAAKGYVVSSYMDKALDKTKVDFTKNFAYFTADADPLPVSQGRDYLPFASKFATEYLSQQEEPGFFLMIEGSQIDWGGHANDSDYIITELLDFDEAIGHVLDFAQQDGETLVIVTSDHETGGYAINPGSTMGNIESGFTTGSHTAALIPVFAYGPGAELFAGMYENTAIYEKMRAAFGFPVNTAKMDAGGK